MTGKQYLYVATMVQGLVCSFAEPAAQDVRTLRLSQDGRKLMHNKEITGYWVLNQNSVFLTYCEDGLPSRVETNEGWLVCCVSCRAAS